MLSMIPLHVLLIFSLVSLTFPKDQLAALPTYVINPTFPVSRILYDDEHPPESEGNRHKFVLPSYIFDKLTEFKYFYNFLSEVYLDDYANGIDQESLASEEVSMDESGVRKEFPHKPLITTSLTPLGFTTLSSSNADVMPIASSHDPDGIPHDGYQAALSFCNNYRLPLKECIDQTAVKLIGLGAPIHSGNIYLFGKNPNFAYSLAKKLFDSDKGGNCVKVLERVFTVLGMEFGPDVLFKDAAVKHQRGFEMYALLGACHFGNNDHLGAERIFKEIFALFPNNSDILLNYITTQVLKGDRGMVLELQNKMESLEEKVPPFTLAQMYQERAVLEFEDLEYGDALVAKQSLARSLETLTIAEADEEFMKYNDQGFLNFNKFSIYNHAANADILLGNFREAKEILLAALSVINTDVQALSNLQMVEFLITLVDHNNAIATAVAKSGEEKPYSLLDGTGPPLFFVTFASDITKCGLKRLQRSAKYHDVNFSILGNNVKKNDWENGMKLKLLKEFSSSVNPDAVVVVVDGYDVVLSGNAGEFFNRYQKLVNRFGLVGNDGEKQNQPEPVIFQADSTFYCPMVDKEENSNVVKNYPPAPTIVRYLSSGGIMGSARAITKLIKKVEKFSLVDWQSKSDQSLFIRWQVENFLSDEKDEEVMIVIDHFQELFSGNGGRVQQKDFDIVGGKLHNKVTDSYPVMFHTPGKDKFQLEMYKLSEMGWNNDIMVCY